MEYKNRIRLEMRSCSENEALARTAAAAFVAELDPTMEELTEIRTAVSEAVSNAVIHAYEPGEEGCIILEAAYTDKGKVIFTVEDQGRGIENVALAREPLFTTGPAGERSGMGFTVMESFMDKLQVESAPGKGTRVTMVKVLDRSYGF